MNLLCLFIRLLLLFIDVQNNALDADSTYTAFVAASANRDVTFFSNWYKPIMTQPPGASGSM